jgi:MFS transporter, DHA1 family, tetracycline resistance protein
LVMTNLFAYFTSPKTPVFFPGAPFLMGAFLTALSVMFAMRTLRKHGTS